MSTETKQRKVRAGEGAEVNTIQKIQPNNSSKTGSGMKYLLPLRIIYI